MSYPFLIAWMAEKAYCFHRANGSSGSDVKLGRVISAIGEIFEAAHQGIAECAAETSLDIAGARLRIMPDFKLDANPMLAVFPRLVEEWNMIQGRRNFVFVLAILRDEMREQVRNRILIPKDFLRQYSKVRNA